MSRKVVVVSPESTLREATDLFLQHHISGVPVVRGTRVVGVLSEKDLVRRVLAQVGRSQLPSHLLALFHEFTAEQAGRLLREVRQVLATTPVSQVMTTHLILVAPDTRLEQAAQTMIDHNIHRLPVVDRGKLVGIVTREDILHFATGALARVFD